MGTSIDTSCETGVYLLDSYHTYSDLEEYQSTESSEEQPFDPQSRQIANTKFGDPGTRCAGCA